MSISTQKTCTVAIEHVHTKSGRAVGNVFAYIGDGRECLELELPLAQQSGWEKIAGPLEYEVAVDIQKALVAFLNGLSIQVFDESIVE